MVLSTMKIKQRWQTGVQAALLILLASSLAPAQTSPTAHVDAASECFGRTGIKSCTSAFSKIGAGVRAVSQGGTLFIRRGSYIEPILLNKPMRIEAYDGPATILAPSPLANFDLVADTLDENKLPLNPKWGFQHITGGIPDQYLCPSGADFPDLQGRWTSDEPDPGNPTCSHQFTYLNTGSVCGPHVNWFGATYEGKIKWQDKSTEGKDDDYNMELRVEHSAGYAATRDYILVEFDSDETVDHFNSPWWSSFHDAVDHKKGNQIDGSFTILTGLMGFDIEHRPHVELHPVWALAMNVNPAIDNDLWTFFVRNWGDEGYCSSDQEFIDYPNNRYTFRLPWKPGATSAQLTTTRCFAYHVQAPFPTDPCSTIRIAPGQGVFITFELDPPREDGSMWFGELGLKWVGQNLSVR